MVRSCCVPLCNNKPYNNGISMHRFPKEPKVHRKWQKAVRCETEKLGFPNMVCSAHFRSSDFLMAPDRKRRFLKKGAIPSVFDWTAEQLERIEAVCDDSGSSLDSMEFEETMPESVEVPIYQNLIDEEPTIQHDTSLEHNFDPEDPLEPSIVKVESLDSMPSVNHDPLESTSVEHEPFDMSIVNLDTADPLERMKEEKRVKQEIEISDTFLSDSLVSDVPTVSNVLANENIKIVDIQDIFNRKTSEREIIGAPGEHRDIPSSNNRVTDSSNVSLQPVNQVETSLLKIYVPKNQSDLKLPNQKISDLDILKSGACLRCKKCKLIVSDITSAKCHKCPPVRNYKCMICNSLFSSIAAWNNHHSLRHPNQNAVCKMFMINSEQNMMQSETQNDFIFSQFELVNVVTQKIGSVKSSNFRPSVAQKSDPTVSHFEPVKTGNQNIDTAKSVPSIGGKSNLKSNNSKLATDQVMNSDTRRVDLSELLKIGNQNVDNAKSSNSGQSLLISSEQPEMVSKFTNSKNPDASDSKIEPANKDISSTNSQAFVEPSPSCSGKSTVNSNTFISASHQEFYKHFCNYHLNFEVNETTLILPKTPWPKVSFQCPRCTKMYVTKEHLVAHLNINHADYQCKLCNFTQNCLEIFLEHECIAGHEILQPGTMFQCAICEELSTHVLKVLGFQRKQELTLHLKNIVINRTRINKVVYFQYKTNVPPKYTPKPQLAKTFSCFCSVIFVSQDELNRHLETHVDSVFRKCSVCGMVCHNMYMYYKHIEQVHESSLLQDLDFRNHRVKLYYRGKEFTCFNQECSETCINNCSLQLHVRQQHTSLEQWSIDGEKLECPICEVVFFDQKLFYAHCVPYTALLPSYTPVLPDCQLGNKIVCRICNVAQESIDDLESHVMNEHNVAMVHCILCKSNIPVEQDAAFSHLKNCYSMNSNIQDNICSICGFICKKSDYLMAHIIYDLQTFLPQYQCKFCLNLFHGKFNLVHHMLNAKCNLCDLYFCNAENLADHRRLVHA